MNTRGERSFLKTEMDWTQYPSLDNEIRIPPHVTPMKGKESQPDNLPFSISDRGLGQI